MMSDGRTVSGPPMTRGVDGVTVHLTAGDLEVPMSLVKQVAASKVAEGVAVEETAESKANKAKGLVEFEGKWVKPATRDAALAKRKAANEKRIADLLAHSKWGDHYKFGSKNFLFEYNVDPEIAKHWAGIMDAYYDNFTKHWGIRPPEGYRKMLEGGGTPGLQINFYHNQEYFNRVTGANGALGYFRFVPPIQLHFFLDRSDEELTMEVMFHECNHYLVWLMDHKYKMPIWLNEGMAEYYGASKWEPKTKKLIVGGLLEGRLAQVQQTISTGQWIGLEELMKVPHEAFDGSYYGWAWLLIHFFMNSEYDKRFRTFFINLPKDKELKREPLDLGDYHMTRHPPEQVITALKRDLKVNNLKDLETQWHNYIKGIQPSSARGYFAAGRSALGDGMPLKAKRMFELAFEKGYDLPQGYAYYARALQRVPASSSDDRGRNLEEARKQFEKVLAADPIDPLFRAEYAELLNKIAKFNGKADPEVEKQLKLARELSNAVEFGVHDYATFLATSFTPYAGEGN